MADDNGQVGLQQREEREQIKRNIQLKRQEEAELEAEYKRRKAEIKNEGKSLQEQLGAAPKGYSKAQWDQAQKDIDVINNIADRVNEEWNKSKHSILLAAKYLYEAKLGVKQIHGASWSFLCKEKLPFGIKTADRLVEIGGCEFIHTNADDLPGAYTTLYEIAKMDDDVRQKAFDEGHINAGSWRRDILAIVNGDNKSKREQEKEDKNKVRTVPIGIINVPVKFFQEEKEGKTKWNAEEVKLFQARIVSSLKDIMNDYKVDGAPNMVDFSKINETLEKQSQREQKKLVVDYSGNEAKVCSKLKKAIKEAVKEGSWKEKYTGSDEKRQNLNADLLSEYNVAYLAASLMEVKGSVDWGAFTVGHITEDMLISMANVSRDQNTSPGN